MADAAAEARQTQKLGEEAPAPDDPRKPAKLRELTKPGWGFTFKSAFRQFMADGCTDMAAALTYFSVLAIFPGLLAVISILGLVGQKDQTTQVLLDLIEQLAPGGAAEQLRAPIENMTGASGSGIMFVIGILAALWSASGYIGGFSRAMNRIYQMDEGRPFTILKPIQLGLTLVSVLVAVLVLVMLAVSGSLAEAIGGVLGLADQTVMIWNIAKWPVVLLLVIALVAVLYYGTPNVRQPKFRWMSVGAAVAILIWLLASAGFGLYVANFANYNKTYGALGGVIVFLLWVWITNNALLFGAEVDSELERARQLQAGLPAEEVLQLPPRSTKASEKAEARAEKAIEEARDIRRQARLDGATGAPSQKERDEKNNGHDDSDSDKDPGTDEDAPDPDGVDGADYHPGERL